MRKRAIFLGAIGAVVLVVVLLLTGNDPKPAGPDWPDPTLARAAARDGSDPSRGAAYYGRPMTNVDVWVTGCKGRMVTGATVLAELGKESYSATTDESGKASVKVPVGMTVDTINARSVNQKGSIVPSTFAPDADLVVDICPGATLYGRVIDHWGHTHADIAIELLDENDVVLDATESDAEGNYLVNDLAVVATSVRVGGIAQPFDGLRAAEQREMDLLMGQTRVVSGYVLDLAGDPVPGVRIELKPMQFEGDGWTAVTSSKGGFSFIAPTTAMRVDADGGDLGRDRVWVNEGTEKRDLELTLEPVGFITVLKKDADSKDAKVAVRTWDQKAFGTDQSWLTGPQQEWQEYEVNGIEPPVLEGNDSIDYVEGQDGVFEGEGEGELEGEGESEGELEPEPMPEQPNEAAMARFMRNMLAEVAPEMLPDGAENMTMEELTGAMGTKAATLSPAQLDEISKRFTSDRVMELSKRLVAEDPELAPLAPQLEMMEEEQRKAKEAEEAQVDLETGPIDSEVPSLEGVEIEVGPAEEAEIVSPDEAMVADYGEGPYPESEYEPSDSEKYATYAEGTLGTQIAVPANLWYEVYVERDDGTETRCGRVMVKAGEELTIRCGGEKLNSVVEGRFVDRRGKPVSNLDVWFTASNTQQPDGYREERQLSGIDGRFRFQIEHDRPMTFTVGVGTANDPWQGNYGRRNIVLAPGDEKDVGDIVWLPEGERPEAWPMAEYGGIGGLIMLEETGVNILDMEEESPLALAGIEKDATIVLIDGIPASELPQDEVFLKLRGAPGTTVDLRLRSAEGELYEVTVERKMMAKPDDIWGPNGTHAQGPDPYLYDL